MIGAVLDTDVFSIIIEDRPQAEKFAPLAYGVQRIPLVTGNGRHFGGLPGLRVLE